MRNKDVDVQESVVNAIKSDDVRNTLKDVFLDVIQSQMEEYSRVPFVERQKAVQRNTFENTEKLLYGLHALEQHLASEKEYLEMAFKQSSGSVVRYKKNKTEKPSDDQILVDRQRSYVRSLHDYKRVKQALDAVADKKGFEIIRLKYLSEERYTFSEIAEKLAGTDGFSENLSEKTVRTYKNILIREIAVLIFGTDAI